MLEEKKIHRRSPNFPAMGLSRAIELVERVYNKAFGSPLETGIFLELMGFKGISGASRTAMSALKQYGLVDGRDDNNRVTKLAEQIIHPIGDLERISAILEAARKPPIFQEIYNQFKGSLPDDKVLKSFLIRKHEFSDSGSELLTKSLRDTEDFISPLRENYDSLLSGEEVSDILKDSTESGVPQSPPSITDIHSNDVALDSIEFLRVRLTSDCTASVKFIGPISKRAIEKLIGYLELSKDSYED